jgi:hypothetical protein
MKTKFLAIAILGIMNSCQSSKTAYDGKFPIDDITVAISGIGCESLCPFEALSIDKKLNANFFGGDFSSKQGFYKGTIPQDIWDTLSNKFNKFIVMGLERPKYYTTDRPTIEFRISSGNLEYQLI